MQYMLIIYTDAATEPRPDSPEFDEYLQGYFKVSQEAQEKGIMIGGNALEGVSAATTVRVRDGKTATTDGPFAETKEQLGGYYLLDCRDLDEAIEYAGKIPGAKFGSVEIRPVKIYEQ